MTETEGAEYIADGPSIAAAYGYSPSTIRTWKDRGHIAEWGRDSHGRILYRVRDVEAFIGKTKRSRSDGAPGSCSWCPLPAHPAAPVPLCIPHIAAVAEFAHQADLVR
jgi:hypothetical protein